jgi:hypothetical protein
MMRTPQREMAEAFIPEKLKRRGKDDKENRQFFRGYV